MHAIDKLIPSILWVVGWRFLFFVLITFLFYRVFGKLGTKAKLIDKPSRWSLSAKPAIGGLVFYIAFCVAVLPLVFYHEGGRGYALLFLTGTCAFALGLWDDIKRIPPSYKMSGQVIVAFIFLASSHTTPIFGNDNPGSHFLMFFQSGCTIFLVVAMMNSINMLDNMDGVATIAVVPIMLFTVYFDCDEARVGIIFSIAMLAFLVFNWTPAKVYMGDSGSMLLGAVAAWMVLGADSCGEIAINIWNGVFRLMLIVGLGTLFIVDTIVVVINRLRHGVSAAKGGKDHTTHNLFYLGMSQWQIAALFVLLGALQLYLVFLFVEDNRLHPEKGMLASSAPIILYFFSLLCFHLILSARNLRKGKYAYHK